MERVTFNIYQIEQNKKVKENVAINYWKEIIMNILQNNGGIYIIYIFKFRKVLWKIK